VWLLRVIRLPGFVSRHGYEKALPYTLETAFACGQASSEGYGAALRTARNHADLGTF